MGAEQTRQTAIACAWKMHIAGFRPRTILNVGVGCCPEYYVWQFAYPNVPVLGVDIRRTKNVPINYVRALATGGESDSSVFCWGCHSLVCKDEKRHRNQHKAEPAVSLDSVVSERSLVPPFFMWMDVDGSELEALKGAGQALKDTGYICIERVEWRHGHRNQIDHILRQHGFRHVANFHQDDLYRNTQQQIHHESCQDEKGNIIVMGVGHSGTTIITQMIAALGWNLLQPGRQFEHKRVRQLNTAASSVFGETRQKLDIKAAGSVLRQCALSQPWIIKDPRFCTTLNQWVELLRPYNPLLVWIKRDDSEVEESWMRRLRARNAWRCDERYRKNATEQTKSGIKRLTDSAEQQYEAWPMKKVVVDYKYIADAVELFHRYT
jgi:hypothetical protein